ncbi:MAG: beta-N-acetylhexosaminidase [Bryobacterales bacterium]|nr:beta-N-acetylhexosaminidase [Bryobacterales bacterium]
MTPNTLVLVLFLSLPVMADTVSPLLARGYTVTPQPQVAKLSAGEFVFSPDWKLELQGVSPADAALEMLRQEFAERFHRTLSPSSSGAGVLRLVIAPGSASVGKAQDRERDVLARQAYKLDLGSNRIVISANAPAGLYYGVATLAQLLKPRDGRLVYPEARIEDWPDLQLRQIYWDDAHHLDRLDTLKQAIRTAAFFKINGFALKLEGHFQFKSAPALVEPYAMTPAEYQELTDYALRRHVQLIPFLDGPAHIAFILKHPEYAKLRAYPDSNYELCVTNPDSYKLLHGMYQDLLDANKGGKYFYLSTDEPYYIGMADNAQCREAARAKELGGVGKLLAEFLHKAAGYLHDRGRTVIFWGEYPLKPGDLASLPPYLVNGEVYGPEFDPLFRKHGIREMIYTSTQGEERQFPQYYPLPPSRRLHQDRPPARRVFDTFQKIAYDTARRDADLMGMISAAWADAGLHPETFWLGYASAAASGWHPGSPDPGETMAAFYPLYYGARVYNMDRVYQLMSGQAQFWWDSWEVGSSKARKPIWGNSEGIFQPPHAARDQSIPLPPAPSPDLGYTNDWTKDNAKRLQLAAGFLVENDELLGLLHANLPLADRNGYNLEVFLSIARLDRHNLEMLRGIARMDGLLRGASHAAEGTRAREAVRLADQAIEQAYEIRYSRNKALADTTATWYKSWFPRVAEANGRRFLHELDDVKDHVPDRTADMTYLVYRELLLPFGEWTEQIRAARNSYAATHGLPARNERFDWKDLAPVHHSATAEISLE